ncbi:hypothetical protein GCM10009836_04270 [Pseudonocardia ailaonensis]|uniref:Uncharacterized protein n=2 Tax=Pseudonocardia ailaonensis TaxID=367279 RepID=A0ABN2MMF7_9PSEU
MGPGGGVRRPAGRRELFLGDATALGLFLELVPTASAAVGAVEVPAATVAAARDLLRGLDVVAGQDEPGAVLRERLAGFGEPPAPACLAGHAGTVQDLRA